MPFWPVRHNSRKLCEEPLLKCKFSLESLIFPRQIITLYHNALLEGGILWDKRKYMQLLWSRGGFGSLTFLQEKRLREQKSLRSADVGWVLLSCIFKAGAMLQYNLYIISLYAYYMRPSNPFSPEKHYIDLGVG